MPSFAATVLNIMLFVLLLSRIERICDVDFKSALMRKRGREQERERENKRKREKRTKEREKRKERERDNKSQKEVKFNEMENFDFSLN